MRRLYKLAALLVLLAILSGSLAAGAGAKPRYSRLTVDAIYMNHWDYGSNPQSVFNGSFSYVAVYQLAAVVAHERRSLSIPDRNARVGAVVLVQDYITVRQPGRAPDFESRHELRECTDPKVAPDPASSESGSVWHNRTGGGEWDPTALSLDTGVFKRSRNASLSVNDGGLFIDPGGRGKFWNPGCHGTSVTEPPGQHGLQQAPQVKLPAPKRSRFNGKKPFSYACSDSWHHEMARASDGSPAAQSHSFGGLTTFHARFRPFPPERLKRVKKRLEKMEGKPTSGAGWASEEKACPVSRG